MSQYRRGADFERRVRDALEADGYEVIRSAGSKTKVDLLGFKVDQLLLIQCKRTDGYIPPDDRLALLALAQMIQPRPYIGTPTPDALAVIAYQPKPRKPIAYRRLTGPGPKDWQPWTPDEVAP